MIRRVGWAGVCGWCEAHAETGGFGRRASPGCGGFVFHRPAGCWRRAGGKGLRWRQQYGLADALRGFGVEVWFDQNELRGGDQWDAKIRSQIKAGAPFIPVISQTTQSRDEACFRLEWKLADDHSHLMAPGKACIVPVVIDATPESGASVPDSFMKAQWTRLPDGQPPTVFIAQVQ